MAQWDKTDKEILRLLLKQGQMTNEKIATDIHASVSTAQRRVQALKAAGVIEGYQAVINQRQIGLDCTVFILVKLQKHGDDSVDKFLREMDAFPNVVEASPITSSWDVMLKIVTRNNERFWAVHKQLLAVSGVLHVRAMVALEPKTKPLPIDDGDFIG